MILVDTSVWISHFRAVNNPQTKLLNSKIDKSADLALCGVILTEVLQGIRSDSVCDEVESYLLKLLYLPIEQSTYLEAAAIYRHLRQRGYTIRNSIDCIIAACAIEHRVPILTSDRDFLPITRFFKLKILS